MSEAVPAAQPEGPQGLPEAASTARGRPPIVRLPTWVNVVLVLTLLASCSAAGQAGDALDQVMGGAGSGTAATDAEVREMCRLLGAVAAEEGIDLEATFADGAHTTCKAAAREGAAP
jgi:hypothetical protein